MYTAPGQWDIFDNLADPVMVFDAHTQQTIFLNTAARNLAKYAFNSSVVPIPPIAWLGENLKLLLDSDDAPTDDADFAVRFEVRHVDRQFDVSAQFSRADEPGREVICLFRNVSKRVEADRQKKELVSTVSHELRSPLTAIKGAMGLILAGKVGDFPNGAHKLVSMAHRNADRLILIINDILDLDKLTDEAMVFDNARTPLTTVIEDAVQSINGYCDDYSVAVETDIHDHALVCDIDPNRIVQVLVNLLSNAIKFSQPGGLVQVSLQPRGPLNRISVIDHGDGIAPQDQDALFQRFVQIGAKHRAATGGTGLGLSIVKAIVEKQGGKISCESEIGIGSTFHVDLPAAQHVQSVDDAQKGLTK